MSDLKPYFTERAQLLFPTLSSTHDWVKANLFSLSTASFISVRAEVQKAGHGQFKRKWISPRGGIWASFLIELIATYQINALAMVLASSMISVLVARGVYPKLKYPNDLLLKGRKLGGVLVEICERRVICSFGINVNIDPKELSGVDQPAISLSDATGEIWPIEALFMEMQEQFQRDFRTFEKMGYAPFSFWDQEWQS